MGSHVGYSVTCHPAEVTFPPLGYLSQLELTFDSATPEGCKTELA